MKGCDKAENEDEKGACICASSQIDHSQNTMELVVASYCSKDELVPRRHAQVSLDARELTSMPMCLAARCINSTGLENRCSACKRHGHRGHVDTCVLRIVSQYRKKCEGIRTSALVVVRHEPTVAPTLVPHPLPLYPCCLKHMPNTNTLHTRTCATK